MKWLKEGSLTDDGEIAPLLELIDEKIAEGEFFRDQWAGWVHGEIPIPSSPAESRLFKSEFNYWGKGCRQFLRIADAPREDLLAALLADRENLSESSG